MTLFNFIYNTIRARVNNPSNARFWLPKVLENIEGSNNNKLLPLKTNEFNVGVIDGEGGTTITNSFKTQYDSYLEHVEGVNLDNQTAIACPKTPNPSLSFKTMELDGLQNLWVLADPPTTSGTFGYNTIINLETNYYDGVTHLPAVPMLKIKGNYLLAQNFCTADIGANTCNGNYSTNINGTGYVDLSINNGLIEADTKIDIKGTGVNRSLNVIVNKVTFKGITASSKPTLKINDLKIIANVSDFLKGVWIEMSTKAINHPETQVSIFSQINATLNTTENLTKLSETMTSQLHKAINGILGNLPPGQLPDDSGQKLANPVDLYIFDRIRFGFNDPTSSTYIPLTISNINSPILDPLQIDKISLPNQDVMGLTAKDIKVENINFDGLTNVIAPSNQVIFNTSTEMTATLNIGDIKNSSKLSNGKTIPLPPLKGKGNFSLSIDGQTLTGGFNVSVSSSQFSFKTVITGDDVSTMVVTLNAANLIAAPNAVTIDIDIASFFEKTINQVINKDDIKNKIISAINSELSNNLASISQEITKVSRTSINNRLKNN
ncbi:hypothetical protein [uncultured Algibacter sp.]|uniref:hypothetical protein n=1 Tax=uncultured Algibacter sp. TaxID=298659 RepID=UPI003217F9EF